MKKSKNRGRTRAENVLVRALILLGAILLAASVFVYGYVAYTRTGTIIPTAELIDGKPTFRFVDVGQGNSTLVTYGAHAVVIDAGTDDAKFDMTEYIKAYAPNIDYLIITHPHDDHMGGAAHLISRARVENLVLRDIEVSDGFYREALDAAQKRGTNVIRLSSAEEFDAGEIHISVLDTFGYEYDDLNDASMVTKVTAGKTSVIIMGDAGTEVEEYLIGHESDRLDCDILEVGHHGSNTSTGEAFLAVTSPEKCVISCGKNNAYGHPMPLILDRIERNGAKKYRTDKSGTIVLRGEKDEKE